MKDRVVIEREWLDKIKNNATEEELDKICRGLIEYGLFGEKITTNNNFVQMTLDFIYPQIDKMQEAYEKKVNKGKNVGRPATIDTETVYKMARNGARAKEIAEVLGKNIKSIYSNQGWINRNNDNFL